jgi:hypothetical protein
MVCDDGPAQSEAHGQLSHDGRADIFSQKALPNESSAHAGQLEGSPEQLAGVAEG